MITKKQELFCREYIINFNATQAAISAGYSEKTATKIGSENLTKPDIQNRISELLNERVERNEINADYVLKRCIEIDELDILDIMDENFNFKPLNQWTKVWRTSITGIDIQELSGNEDTVSLIKKIKWPDKIKNLELLGRHINVQAFKEKRDVEITAEVIPPQMDLTRLSDEQLEQLKFITESAMPQSDS
ncbi:terminase small subunit [Thorsellia anophelis]|uniref:Phage terminase small subunit n=1 Tax=Thorsellia anophelis DSM 18579 TaxID=1123402 RepID=A0A1I0CDG2_9GAMM|nr:terminase small subunit [Thorsellia anophelis]SET17061.1 phage terminase small subunit [Thorsellia anophelis DSM 18579]